MTKSSAPDRWLTLDSAILHPSSPRPVTRVPRPARAMRPPRPARRAGPRLVLALLDADRPTPALRRALALARSLEGELHVLRVLPGLTHLEAFFFRNHERNAARAVQRTLRARRITQSWLRVTLGSADAIERLCIAHGEFVEQAAAYAASVDARMIIVSPRIRRLGRTATSLARAAQRPVLVAREHRGNHAILAATDLRTSGHPVLQGAAELGQRLRAKLVALHNVHVGGAAGLVPGVRAEGVMTIGAGEWPSVHQQGVLRSERLNQLTAAAAQLPIEADAVVLSEADAAHAILAQAGVQDPDCVVVGARQRTWLEGLAFRSVAREVVEQAQHSVLVVPLDVAIAASVPVLCLPSPVPPPMP
jgi:nucleotide-binding universal stress UspA family protein